MKHKRAAWREYEKLVAFVIQLWKKCEKIAGVLARDYEKTASDSEITASVWKDSDMTVGVCQYIPFILF